MKMKKILIFVALMVTGLVAAAQNVYKTEFSNSSENIVKILAAPQSVTIVGHNRNEIVIEVTYKDGQKREIPEKEHGETSERAKGLKPLTSSGTDNTGIGLTVEKSGNQFVVRGLVGSTREGNYVFKIPNKVNLTINEIGAWSRSSYEITGLQGELNITGLNSGFLIRDVSGPAVIKNTNGNVEIAFSRLTPDKPNSITTVNGFVDITLPANTKSDFNVNTINGKAFSDFDIETNSGGDTPFPHGAERTLGIPFGLDFNIFRLKGAINGGGTPFNVSAVNGNVYLRKGS
jgi:hypothetical protein